MSGVYVLANPMGGLGRVQRELPKLRRSLRTILGAHELWLTCGPGDARLLARRACLAGAEAVLVVGGDGTAREVAQALLLQPVEARPALGILPLGTGSDLARHVGLARDTEEALRRFAHGIARTLDAGVVRCGRAATPQYYLNVLSLGVSAESVRRVEMAARRGRRGRFSYLTSAVRSIVDFRAPRLSVRLDGEPFFEGPVAQLAVANGRYFGAGFAIAPQARLDDGLLDVTLVEDVSPRRGLGLLARAYAGNLHRASGVHFRRARHVMLDGPESTIIEADGEIVGQLPAEVEVLPGALRLRA